MRTGTTFRHARLHYNGLVLLADLPSRIKQFAREIGFDLCGIAPVREFREIESFPAWIAAGHVPRFFPMLMTAAGTVASAKVFVVGAGVAGLSAIALRHPYSFDRLVVVKFDQVAYRAVAGNKFLLNPR
jgi:hypothetical protein